MKLTQERLKELLHYNPEDGVFTRLITVQYAAKEGDIAGTLQPSGYLAIAIDGVDYRLHRLAFFYMKGFWPVQIDHENHDRADNRWRNIKETDKAGNARNMSMQKRNKSGFNGVGWDKARGKWYAEIRFQGNKIFLGRFDEKADAVNARKAANKKYGFHKAHGVEAGARAAL